MMGIDATSFIMSSTVPHAWKLLELRDTPNLLPGRQVPLSRKRMRTTSG